ncbi:MFS transporter [Thioclava dalianensis]|uniref:MFS transporter n=1 Tax=Thioclava dalianensis TaxID=1185766 RepID=A0A074TJ15_9RHOB|nr:MFS transporter [Thioclava dalianensis]KEP69008.1 MFS transporter [Thioclava dalianensis]SFM88491.1 MFS transporter, DHA1 family, inner membrane transport protein [Thioclava dalianensis]
MSLSPRKARAVILSLALGTFGIGVIEFASMGLLPFYAADFGISEARAGHAISSYALGVVIGAPLLAVAGAKLPRKGFLIGLMGFYALANIVAGFAPNMTTFTIARFFSGLPHGAYFGMAMLFAADLMPKGKRAQGIALVISGLTVANIIGVPLAGAIGQYFGWRWGFAIVAVICGLSTLLIARHAPVVPRDPDASPMQELRALANRSVWLTLAVGSVGFGGVFAVYSYLSATMIDTQAGPSWTIPIALSAFGIGGTLGNMIAGRLSDWSRFGAGVILLSGMAVMTLLYTITIGHWEWMSVAMIAMGTTAGLIIPMQMRLMEVAGRAQTLAAALNHAAFNLGNALGPFFAGLALSAGYGWQSTGIVGTAMALVGLAFLGIAYLDSRRPEPLPA